MLGAVGATAELEEGLKPKRPSWQVGRSHTLSSNAPDTQAPRDQLKSHLLPTRQGQCENSFVTLRQPHDGESSDRCSQTACYSSAMSALCTYLHPSFSWICRCQHFPDDRRKNDPFCGSKSRKSPTPFMPSAWSDFVVDQLLCLFPHREKMSSVAGWGPLQSSFCLSGHLETNVGGSATYE